MITTPAVNNISQYSSVIGYSTPGLPGIQYLAQDTFNNKTYNNYTYGESDYGEAGYNGEVVVAEGKPNGPLLNTGTVISLSVATASLIILIAIAVRVWKRPSKTKKR